MTEKPPATRYLCVGCIEIWRCPLVCPTCGEPGWLVSGSYAGATDEAIIYWTRIDRAMENLRTWMDGAAYLANVQTPIKKRTRK